MACAAVVDMLKTDPECADAYQVMPRRPGDVAQYYADPALAHEQLGWPARRSLAEMCADAWRWQSQNPSGCK
ncbi:MAG: hypothetical protein GZ093_19770 [Rhodoferax sp.]|uniref:hypothetical protein n=1 Tax=Rhodoferax sp. TaxID=50421 RepID=UPI0013FEE465|nr:hypothetical protein [Rhodoferax sp.]